jgi:hypothetical protein
MKFVVARMSFVPFEQQNLFDLPVDRTPIEIAEEILQTRPRYTPTKGNTIGFVLGSFQVLEGRLLAAKLGILRGVTLSKYNEDNHQFVDVKDDSYEKVALLWDREQQAILLERNTTIYYEPERLFEYIQSHLNLALSHYGLSVTIRVIPEPMSFWKTIEKYEKIYSVRFKLTIPNMFGFTQKSLADWLQGFKEEANATEVTTEVSNPEGKLELNTTDPQLHEAVNWVEKGGGEWSVVGGGKGKKRTSRSKTSSSKSMKRLDHPGTLEEFTAEEVAKAMKELRPGYAIDLSRKPGDD